MGPSGCGKSSLLRIIAGLWTIGGGTIRGPHPQQIFFLPQVGGGNRLAINAGCCGSSCIDPAGHRSFESFKIALEIFSGLQRVWDHCRVLVEVMPRTDDCRHHLMLRVV